jgi:hypothetical protein
MKLKFKTILFFCYIFFFIILASAQAEELKEKDELKQTLGINAEGSLLIDQIAGVYKKRFKNAFYVDASKGLMESCVAEDILEIVKVTENIIYFKFHLEFFNGHICSMFGIAYYIGNNAFLFKDETFPFEDDEGRRCNLKIIVTAQNIELIDNYGCRSSYCGTRGGINGQSFKRKTRRPIKYMKLLKSSADYQQSIKTLAEK